MATATINVDMPLMDELLKMRLCEVERFIIEKRMEKNGFNIAKTATDLGISRATLYRKLHDYGFVRFTSGGKDVES